MDHRTAHARPLQRVGGARSLLTVVIAATSTALACSTGEPASPNNPATIAGPPTYIRDVAPILQHRCVKCHYEGGIGPFALTSYELARAMAPAIVVETGARRMPPWGAQDTAECKPPLPWHDDERLSDEEIRTLRDWDRGGALVGDPATGPVETVPVQSLELTTPSLDVTTRAPYTPVASALDEFRCFVLDAPEIEAGGYISALHVVPGNRKIVHHVTVFTDADGLLSKKRAGPDGSFDCPPGSNIEIASSLDGTPRFATILQWAPGAKPLELPAGAGIEVLPNSKIVMEVHYSTGGKQPEPDRTRLQVLLSPTKPDRIVSLWGVGNLSARLDNGDGLLPGDDDTNGEIEFRIPAHARRHVETMEITYPNDQPLSLFGFRPHAHLAAIDLKVDIVHDGIPQCMVEDRWDFHWQRTYTYDAPQEALPLLHKGDKVRIRCTYDNSMANIRLAQELRARELQPMDIPLGNDTLSEMCLVDLLFMQKVAR